MARWRKKGRAKSFAPKEIEEAAGAGYLETVARLARAHPQLAHELSEFLTLEDVFRWKSGSLSQIQTVVQDEFSHDVVLEHEGHFVAFGAT